MVEHPADLGAREVGVHHQPGLPPDLGLGPVGAEVVAERGGAPALPDDRVADRPPGGALPEDGGLALVGDAHRRDLGRRDAGGGHRLAEGLHGGGPDLGRIVLDPARLRVELRQLRVAPRPDVAVGIQH